MKKSAKSGGKPDALILKAAEAGDLKAVRERLAAGVDINAAPKNEAPAILLAVKRGHLEVVQALIDAGADINCIAYPPGGSLKSTPLCCAIENEHWEIVQALLKAGVDLAVEPVKGDNALGAAAEKASRAHFSLTASDEEWLSSRKRNKEFMEKARVDHDRWMQFIRDAVAKGVKVRDYWLWNAANHRHAELVSLLLGAGVNPNAAPHGSSALVRAIEHGEDEIALTIIKAGADVNLKARNAPLLAAAEKGRVSVVPALLDAGADINVTGDVTIKEGDDDDFDAPVAEASTPLIVATRLGNEAFVKLLVGRGADVNISDKHGITALAWATRLQKQAIIDILKNTGAREPEFLEGSLGTALWTAAKDGDADKVQMLLSRGAKPDEVVEDREGKHVPLVSAAREGHVKVVQLLLQHGANVNAGAEENWAGNVTPLMAASRTGRVEVIKTLLAAKADVAAKDIQLDGGAETALHYAARGGHAEAITTLLAAGAEVNAKAKGGHTPLCFAAGGKKYDAAKALLDGNADANAGPSDGSGPLFSAAMESDVEMVKLLLAHGAQPLPRGKKLSSIPLQTAASKGSVEIVQLLLKAGAPVDAQSSLGDTALSRSSLYGLEDVVKMLLAAGANPNVADRDGFTPLMGAVRSGKESIVRMLLEAGADVSAVNKSGQDALKMAQSSKKREIVALLEAAPKSELAVAPAQKKSAPPKEQAKKEEPEEEEEFEAPDFSEAAAAPEFQSALQEVEKLCGTKPDSLGDIEGGYSFSLSGGDAEKLVAEHHQALLKKGAYLFRHDRDQAKLGLLPTRDWVDLIRAFQTNGANFDLMPADIAKWLQKLSTQQPFVITGAGRDWLEGRFTTAIKNPRKLAHQLYEFCPDIVDQGIGSVKDLATALEKDGYFFFWWD